MLSFLLEKFIRRLCGRWLKNLTTDSLSVSLGGSIELCDLELDVTELSKMCLPLDPVYGKCGKLRIELPLSLTGELVVAAEDVVIRFKLQDFDVDPEAARRAVEIAINLYWTNYLRSPQLLDNPPKKQEIDVADTIVSLAKCTRIELRRFRIECEEYAVDVDELVVAPDGTKKKLTLKNCRLDDIQVSSLQVDCDLDIEHVASAIAELPPASDLTESRSSVDGNSTLLPWLHACTLKVKAQGVRANVSTALLKFVLRVTDLISTCHARRQDAARSSKCVPRPKPPSPPLPFAQILYDSSDDEDPRQRPEKSSSSSPQTSSSERCRVLWACAIGRVLADLARKKGRRRWRVWFEEWRRAARYVAIRKLLMPQLKCGIFRHAGELYYELNETCCVTRAGKFYVYPAQLPVDEVQKAREVISKATRTAPLLSSRRIKKSDRVEPRLAVALYAEQLWIDSTLPAHQAAGLRALAKRQLKSQKKTQADNFARVYSMNSPSILIAPIDIKGIDDNYLSDVRLDFSTTSKGASSTSRSGPGKFKGDTLVFDDDLVEISAGETTTVAVVDVGVSGAYETRLGEAQTSAEGLVEIVVPVDSVWEDKTMRLRLGIKRCKSGKEIHKARKSLAYLVNKERSVTNAPRSTRLSVDAKIDRVDLRLEKVAAFTCSSVSGQTAVSVPGANVNVPAGTGEGSVLASFLRAVTELLKPTQDEMLWRCDRSGRLYLTQQNGKETWHRVRTAKSRQFQNDEGVLVAIAPDYTVTSRVDDSIRYLSSDRRSFFVQSTTVLGSRSFDFDGVKLSLVVNQRPVIGSYCEPPLYALTQHGQQPEELSFPVFDEIVEPVFVPPSPKKNSAIQTPARSTASASENVCSVTPDDDESEEEKTFQPISPAAETKPFTEPVPKEHVATLPSPPRTTTQEKKPTPKPAPQQQQQQQHVPSATPKQQQQQQQKPVDSSCSCAIQ